MPQTELPYSAMWKLYWGVWFIFTAVTLVTGVEDVRVATNAQSSEEMLFRAPLGRLAFVPAVADLVSLVGLTGFVFRRRFGVPTLWRVWLCLAVGVYVVSRAWLWVQTWWLLPMTGLTDHRMWWWAGLSEALEATLRLPVLLALLWYARAAWPAVEESE